MDGKIKVDSALPGCWLLEEAWLSSTCVVSVCDQVSDVNEPLLAAEKLDETLEEDCVTFDPSLGAAAETTGSAASSELVTLADDTAVLWRSAVATADVRLCTLARIEPAEGGVSGPSGNMDAVCSCALSIVAVVPCDTAAGVEPIEPCTGSDEVEFGKIHGSVGCREEPCSEAAWLGSGVGGNSVVLRVPLGLLLPLALSPPGAANAVVEGEVLVADVSVSSVDIQSVASPGDAGFCAVAAVLKLGLWPSAAAGQGSVVMVVEVENSTITVEVTASGCELCVVPSDGSVSIPVLVLSSQVSLPTDSTQMVTVVVATTPKSPVTSVELEGDGDVAALSEAVTVVKTSMVVVAVTTTRSHG